MKFSQEYCNLNVSKQKQTLKSILLFPFAKKSYNLKATSEDYWGKKGKEVQEIKLYFKLWHDLIFFLWIEVILVCLNIDTFWEKMWKMDPGKTG